MARSAMTKSAILSIKIVSDAKDASKGLDEATGRLDKLQQKVDRAALPAAAIGAAATAAGKHFINYASDAEQAVGGVNTVYGKHADEVMARSKQADQALGLSEQAYNSLATTVGGSLKQAGYASDELGGKTDDLITRAADLSSVFGGDTVGATEAMGAALRGEFDSLERYGVFLNASAVNAELARKGQDNLTGAALDAAKKQATYNLIMEQSADYAGNFAREADTAAGAEQRAQAARDNAAAKIGANLLPAYTALMGVLASVATFVGENSTAVAALLVVMASLSGLVLATSAALKVYTAVKTAWTAATKLATLAQKALNVALRANPIGIIITAATALVGLLVLLYNRSETFRNAVNAAGKAGQAALSWVIDKARALGSQVLAVVGRISSGWSSMTSTVRSLFSSASSAVRGAINQVGSTVTSIVNAIRARWQSMTTAVSTLWTGATNRVKSAGSAVATALSGVMTRIRSAIQRVLDIIGRIGGAFRTASAGATGAINGVINVVRNLVSWITSALNKLGPLKSAGGWIKKGIGWITGSQRLTPAWDIPRDGSTPFYLTAANAASLIPAAPLAATRRGTPAPRLVQVNIHGAIDPNRTARKVREVLKLDALRDGGDSIWR